MPLYPPLLSQCVFFYPATATQQLNVARLWYPEGSHVFCRPQSGATEHMEGLLSVGSCQDFCAGRNHFATFSCPLKKSCQCAVNI